MDSPERQPEVVKCLSFDLSTELKRRSSSAKDVNRKLDVPCYGLQLFITKGWLALLFWLVIYHNGPDGIKMRHKG